MKPVKNLTKMVFVLQEETFDGRSSYRSVCPGCSWINYFYPFELEGAQFQCRGCGISLESEERI